VEKRNRHKGSKKSRNKQVCTSLGLLINGDFLKMGRFAKVSITLGFVTAISTAIKMGKLHSKSPSALGGRS
jgi:hypothetical protein